jgi:hypothetical protein
VVAKRLSSQWFELFKATLLGGNPSEMVCPFSGSVGLEILGHVEVPEDRLGWCVLRCKTCGHGAWYSRLHVPPQFESPINPAEWPDTTIDP